MVLCLFSSIGYAHGVRDLRRAVARMADHLAPGGVLVVEPWLSLEEFRPDSVHSSRHTAGDLHVVRMVTSRRRRRLSVMDMHHLVGTPEGTRHFVERHELWMFTDAELRDAFERAGLETTHDARGLMGRGLWIGRRGA